MARLAFAMMLACWLAADTLLTAQVAPGDPVIPGVTVLDEIIVRGQPEPETPSRQTLQGDDIRHMAGATGDVLRALPVLPGISNVSDLSGELFIRGGGPNDNVFYFNRIPLGYPYHFGGLTSTLSSELIGRVDVHAGGFGARFGDAQAVVDIIAREDGRRDFRMASNVNALLSESFVQSPIGDRGSFYLAGRRTYADLIVPHVVELDSVTAFPRFWDYQAGVEYDLSPTNHLQLDAFAADDVMGFRIDEEDITEAPELAGDFRFSTAFQGQGATLSTRLTERLSLLSSLSHIKHAAHLSIGQGYFLNLAPEFWYLREDLSWKAHPRHTIQVGTELESGPFEVSALFVRPPSDEDAGKEYDFTNAEKIRSDSRDRFTFGYGYIQDHVTLADALSLTVGGRVGYMNRTDQVMFDPRASLSWELSGGRTLRLAWGGYHKTPEPNEVAPEWGNTDLRASKAIHYVIEAERRFSESTYMTVAGYYKDMHDLVTEDSEAIYLNQGKGYVRGLEVLLRHRPSERLSTWLSYTYSQSRRTYRPSTPEVPYSYDQTHVATATATYTPNPKWELGFKWHYATGVPFTPVTRGELVTNPSSGASKYEPVYGETNSDRLSPFHRLDLRVARTFSFDGWHLQAYLEVLNAYAHKNVLGVGYNDDYTERNDVYQLPLIPFIGFRADF